MTENKNKTMLSQEAALNEQIHNELETSYKESQQIGKEISRALAYRASPVRNIPIVRDLVKFGMGVKPLTSLEQTLGRSFKSSLNSMAQVGKKSIELENRAVELESVYEQSVTEDWSPATFLSYLESNDGLGFTVTDADGQMDFKELIHHFYEGKTQDAQVQDKQAYQTWFKNHITLTKNFASGMKALTYTGTQWLTEMAQSYFDLRSFRESMVLIERTQRVLGEGGTASITTQDAIGQFGTTYTKGIKALMDGYEKVQHLRETSVDNFTPAIQGLENRLATVKGEITLPEKAEAGYKVYGVN